MSEADDRQAPTTGSTPPPLGAAPAIGPVVEPPRVSLRATVRLAFSGHELDFTREPLRRAITLLALPMALELALESVFAVVDVFFVARLGVAAVAAVGLTEAAVTLIYAVATGASAATTALVARRYGEGRRAEAAIAGVQSIYVALAISAAVAGLGLPGAAALLQIMGGSPTVVETGRGFTAVLLGGSATIMLLFINNAILRGTGDAARALRALWLANVANIVLDPCLIFGLGPFPELGLTGAAVATTTGRGLGIVYQLAVLTRGNARLRIDRSALPVRWTVVRGFLRIAAGGVGQYLISTSSWIVLVRLLSGFGAVAVAGYTIAIRIVGFALLPSWGVANAAATLVGQNLGARRPDRARSATWLAGVYNAVFLSLVAVGFIAAARPVVGLFTSNPEVVGIGAACLRILAYGYGFYAFGMVVVQAFNGAGDTVTPTVINVFCYWLFEIPLAWLLARGLARGPAGVFWAITIAEAVMTIVAVLAFRRGRWLARRI
jgi:putative MATE family efflux protein